MILARGIRIGDSRPQDVVLESLTRGVHIIGNPNSGKTSLMKHMIRQTPACGVIDVEETIPFPADILFDPTRSIQPFNLLKTERPYATVEDILACFRRAWPDGWGDRMADILRNSLLLAIEFDLKLTDLPRILSDEMYRERLANQSEDERVRMFFLDHLKNLPAREWRYWVESARNKVSAFTLSPYIRPFLETEDCLDLKEVMDQRKSIYFSLPERLMKDSSALLGMLIVSRIYSAALERPEGSAPWILFADEFQRLASQSFVDLAVRGRKRGVGIVVAHQSLVQPPFDRENGFIETILNTLGTTVVFSVGRRDAERLAKEVLPPSGTVIKRAKTKHWLFGGQDVQSFYSVQEEIEQMATEIERQKQGECFIKIRGQEMAVYACTTFEAPATTPAVGKILALDTRKAPKQPQEPKATKVAKKRAIAPRPQKQESDPLDL